MEKTLFSTPELAEWLGVFHTTVRRWIEHGKIRGIRVGRNYKIPINEVIRVLNGYGISLPEVIKKYKQKQKYEAKNIPPSDGYRGSILQKLLIVEEIGDPAFVCRRESVLGANEAFADLVGLSQADLIGVDIAEILVEDSDGSAIDFALKRMEQPNKGPVDHAAFLKTGENGGKNVKVAAGTLGDMKDVFLVVVKNVGMMG